MDRIISPFKLSKKINKVFLAGIFLSFHGYLIVYINSTFLDRFFSETQIGALYLIGATLNMVILLNISKILNAIGNYRLTAYAIAAEILALVGFLVTSTPFLIGFYFILHQIMISLIPVSLDIFLESASTDESKTGEIRGMFLTLQNLVLVICPAIVGILLVNNAYGRVYFLSLLFLIPLYFVLKNNFKDYQDKILVHVHIKETIRDYLANKKMFNTFAVYFLLQLFYAFMVVYTPLYLEKYIGFTWSETGIMFTIMLLPFVLFELPAGDQADRRHDEREIMTVGLVIMGLTTLFLSFINAKVFWIWTAVLFITRIGAALVEVTVDSYFFKMVNQDKADLISFYRVARPLSYVVAPIIATVALQFLPYQYIFLVVGIITIIGVRYSLALPNSVGKPAIPDTPVPLHKNN